MTKVGVEKGKKKKKKKGKKKKKKKAIFIGTFFNVKHWRNGID